MAQMANLRALVEIRRHINGFQKIRKWKANSTQYSTDVLRIVKQWKQVVIDRKRK